MKWLLAAALLIATFVGWAGPVRAQVTEEDFEVDEIETEIKKSAPKPRVQAPATKASEPVEALSDLKSLVPFADVSVLQKRFLPKTKRFQFFTGLSAIVNDPWFIGAGVGAKAGYHFTEAFGIEGNFLFLSTSQRQAAKDLLSENSVSTSSLLTPKSFYGLDAVWTPIFGKMGLLNKKIVPFDMYFTVGGGFTNVENGEGGATLHLGTGQIFALSKSKGLRWDFSWNAFQGTPQGREKQTFNNLLLTVGMSFFFPEVSSR